MMTVCFASSAGRGRVPCACFDRRGEVFAGTIAYRPDGAVYTPATLQLCAGAAVRNVRLVVSMTGRVRTAREDHPCA